MGHELRTPLNGVIGYTDLLMQDPLTEWQASAIGTIRKCGEHLLALINDLLDHAKHRAGKLELCPVALPLHEHLEATCDIVRVMAEEARLDFVCEVADDVPGRVVVDGKRLRQVLLNLLGNAIKFTEAGQVMLKVRADRVDEGQVRLHFEVRDTGVGLREDQYESIFEPFEQVGDAHRRTCGSGLGLAISRQIVRLMGGDIRVASTLACGTTFSFHFDVTALPPWQAQGQQMVACD
jgi:signal transduction histidine kinase